MKILHILRQDPGDTGQEIIQEHEKSHDVTVVDIRKEKDYGKIVDLIEACDRVISW